LLTHRTSTIGWRQGSVAGPATPQDQGFAGQGFEGEKPMSISVGKLDHYNVSTRKLGDTVRFYEDILGLENGPRPPFDFPGAWLYSEGHPVLHLNDISPTDKPQRPDSGVIDHVAFGSRGFEEMKQRLAQKGVEFRVNVVPNSTRRQIFLTDPNNVLIELNYDVAAERG
jgi:catechol 2,3-dioxygenase-like lactoylglutathione lyase family enzyme